jgi:hydrogenase small subunit
MSKISRRDFMRLAMAAGAATTGMGRVVEALAATPALPAVIWLQGQSCSGCSVSALNSTYPDIAKVITEVISLKYHATLMSGTGDVSTRVIEEVVAKRAGEIVLVVEEAIPTTDTEFCTLGQRNGHAIPFSELVLEVAKASQAAVAVGACSAFGGIPAAQGNVTGALPAEKWFKEKGVDIPVINVGGCPPHPDWMVGTIAHYLWYGVPELDGHGRPKMFFDNNVHENCERYSYFEAEKSPRTTASLSASASWAARGRTRTAM